MTLNVFVNFSASAPPKKPVQTNCESSSPFSPLVVLAFEQLRAGTSTQTRRSLAPVVVGTSAPFPFPFHSSLRSGKFWLRCLSLTRSSFRCAGFGTLCSLSFNSLMPSRICCMSVILQLLQHFPRSTTARRSHDRPHTTPSPSTEASLPLTSFCNSSAVDRVTCLFQAHGLTENSL